ncbi:hypothetical protein Cgig2_026959 [Carnegiea gigantea]|uniref:Uncharacterized protein n=1 Tax=Carnegiea gigantea TaxID=171969 RepID=A0A9Q1KY23_9CARY|nr:hypothetical protein Cgig2_026959 [Carnegiea gigantea]
MEKDQADLHEHQKPSAKQTQKPQKNQKTPSLKPTTTANNNNNNKKDNKQRPIWDCGSTLYDSFELDSFRKQLDSAIITSSSRTLSMPRLPSQGGPPPPHKPPPSKLSRTFRKLLNSVFRPRNTSRPMNYDSGPDIGPGVPGHPDQSEKLKQIGGGSNNNNKYFVVYEKVNALSSIPEVPEAAFSPEIGSLARKTMSQRFSSGVVLMILLLMSWLVT